MTARQKQSLFVDLIGRLIEWAYDRGYELTFGEAYRSKEEAARLASIGAGIANSLHCERLAIDINLFIDGKYQSSSEAYRPLGEFWKSLHPLCRWGGDFKRADGNHLSLTHGGRS